MVWGGRCRYARCCGSVRLATACISGIGQFALFWTSRGTASGRGVSLFALRFVVSVALAAVSYYLLEMPIRRAVCSSSQDCDVQPVDRTIAPRLPERPGRQGAWPLIAAVASSSLLVAGLLTWATRPPQLTATVAKALDEAQSRATSNKAATPGLLPATTPLRIVVMGDSVGANIGAGMSAPLAEQRGFKDRDRSPRLAVHFRSRGAEQRHKRLDRRRRPLRSDSQHVR